MTANGFRNLTTTFIGLIYGVTATAQDRDTGVALLEIVAPAGQNLEELVRARLPKSDTFVVVEAIPNTKLVQLTVFEPSQDQAARRARSRCASFSALLKLRCPWQTPGHNEGTRPKYRARLAPCERSRASLARAVMA